MAMPICMYSSPNEDEVKCVVEFDLNYDGAKAIESISVNKGRAIQMGDCRLPEREGYRFAGWYTSKECKPEQQWLFGTKKTGNYSRIILQQLRISLSCACRLKKKFICVAVRMHLSMPSQSYQQLIMLHLHYQPVLCANLLNHLDCALTPVEIFLLVGQISLQNVECKIVLA